MGTILGRVTSFIFEAKLFFVPGGLSGPCGELSGIPGHHSLLLVHDPFSCARCDHQRCLWVCVRARVLSRFSHVQLFSTLLGLGCSVHGILQARILEWVAISSSRGSYRSRDRTHVSYISCIGRQVLYHSHHLGNPKDVSGHRQMSLKRQP